MDEFVAALAQSIVAGGPGYAGIFLAGWAFFSKIWPAIEQKMKRADERADRREKREAEEAARRAERDAELAKMEGRWLEQYTHANSVQEQSNTIMTSIDARLERFSNSILDSKERSRDMGHKIDEMHAVMVLNKEFKEGTD